jgi:hypothetical protein
MLRVLRQDGYMAVAVWDSLENTPGYAAITELLERLFGDKVADAMREPFVLGDIEVLRSLFTDAGVASVEIETHEGIVRFPSISSWIYTDIKGWTLADLIDDAQYQLLLQEAESELRRFVTSESTILSVYPHTLLPPSKHDAIKFSMCFRLIANIDSMEHDFGYRKMLVFYSLLLSYP